MYNVRYHIASLVSVFLALALGLVLGGLVVGRGTLDRQQTVLVEGLRKEFNSLRTENRALSQENRLLDSYAGDMVDSWAQDRLKGRTVLVVTAPGDPLTRTTVRAIESAGGEAAVVTVKSSDFGLSDTKTRAVVASLAADADDPAASIAASLSAEWSGPGPERPLTQALADAGVLDISGLDEGRMASGAVGLAAFGGKADPGALALLKSFGELGLPAIGAQSPETNTGMAEGASGAGLAALDTLGTDVGRYTMVVLLDGKEKGYFGTAAGASAPYPDTQE